MTFPWQQRTCALFVLAAGLLACTGMARAQSQEVQATGTKLQYTLAESVPLGSGFAYDTLPQACAAMTAKLQNAFGAGNVQMTRCYEVGDGATWGYDFTVSIGGSPQATQYFSPIVRVATCPANAGAESTKCYCDTGWTPDTYTSSSVPPPRCVAVADETSAEASTATCTAEASAGNPILPLRGTKRELVDTGLHIGALTLRFTYDNTPRIPVAVNGPRLSTRAGVLGALWSSSLHRQLTIQGNGRAAIAQRGDGRSIAFAGNGSGTYTAPADTRDRLTSIAGGYRYLHAADSSLETYNTQGQLTAIAWGTGARITLTYSDASTPATHAPKPGYLLQAQDATGRSLQLRYNAAGRLTQAIDPSGQTLALGYDTRDNLATLGWADGRTRTFLYENATFGWALTGVTDERAIRQSTFGYDSEGRAISTERAGGVDKYTATYTTPPRLSVTQTYDSTRQLVVRRHGWSLAAGTTLTGPRGAASLGTALIQGKNHLTSQSQPAGAGCAASTSSQGFDANGNLAQRDDFNGTRSCHVSDPARNLETVRVEGLANTVACASVTAANATLPTGSRKLSTQWHPDWPLPAKTASPGTLTTHVYNGQPDPFNGNAIASCAPSGALLPDGKPLALLCRQVEQATTDASGRLGFGATLQSGVANRQTTWTYNARGQVLTRRGPRTDLDDSSTFTYYEDTTADHTVGDLQRSTNALGQSVQYTRYNPHGQVLQSTDANGIATTFSYDPRQRLLSSTTAGRTTAYTYDEAGQLKRVTLPDATWVGYDYDGAHRLVAVYDHLGHRTDYTLDAAGNRTGEATKDPLGQLQRQLTRVMDALARVQQTTGRE